MAKTRTPARRTLGRALGRKPPPGHLRLIGGRFGGRRLPIPDQAGLRPTGDRTRETLFNWLAPTIAGSHCLDAFAGSGALGFEAVSRGAGLVVMLERNAAVARQLRANAAILAAEETRVHHVDSLLWLGKAEPRRFDIVFLDPPFADRLLAASLDALRGRPWLAPAARVYLETDARAPFPELPAGWTWLREKTAGQVRFGLALAPSTD